MIDLLEVCLRRKILVPVGIMACYTVGMVRVLSAIGLWTTGLLKDTVLWFVLTGVPLAVKYVTEREGSIFRDIVCDNVRAVVLVEFFVSTYTFSLVWELLFVPFVTVIAIMDVVANKDNKYASIAKLTSSLQGVTGFTIVTFAVYRAVADYVQLLSFDTLKSVLLAPLLSVLYSPFVYVLALYAEYELLFMRLNTAAV